MIVHSRPFSLEHVRQSLHSSLRTFSIQVFSKKKSRNWLRLLGVKPQIYKQISLAEVTWNFSGWSRDRRWRSDGLHVEHVTSEVDLKTTKYTMICISKVIPADRKAFILHTLCTTQTNPRLNQIVILNFSR